MDGIGDKPTDFTLCFIHHNAFHAIYETWVSLRHLFLSPQMWPQYIKKQDSYKIQLKGSIPSKMNILSTHDSLIQIHQSADISGHPSMATPWL
jgi:hypothetical protein